MSHPSASIFWLYIQKISRTQLFLTTFTPSTLFSLFLLLHPYHSFSTEQPGQFCQNTSHQINPLLKMMQQLPMSLGVKPYYYSGHPPLFGWPFIQSSTPLTHFSLPSFLLITPFQPPATPPTCWIHTCLRYTPAPRVSSTIATWLAPSFPRCSSKVVSVWPYLANLFKTETSPPPPFLILLLCISPYLSLPYSFCLLSTYAHRYGHSPFVYLVYPHHSKSYLVHSRQLSICHKWIKITV